MKCVGIAVVGAILALTTKKHSSEFAVMLSIGVVLLLTSLLLVFLKPVLSFLEELQDRAALGSTAASPVMKTLAIGFLTETGKNICDEAGEKTVGQVLSVSGSIAAVYVLLPLMESVLDLLEQLL